MAWSTDDIPDQSDRRFVITGANSGIGKEAARELARAGGTVVMACRSLDRGETARDEIREEIPGASLRVEPLDLASLDSVHDFAHRLDGPIDVLINNAGVMAIPRTETDDGFEMQFGVNHLGHFALTGLLVDQLEDRVVTVSSRAHENGDIDFDDPHSRVNYDRWEAYGQSKLANLLFAYELDRRSDLTSLACHPGFAATNLQNGAATSLPMRVVMGVINRVIAQSAADGALPTLYAATDRDAEGGQYIGPNGLGQMRGAPEPQESTDRSYDEPLAKRLWTLSEAETEVTYPF